MSCVWLRTKTGNICDLPSGPRQVGCGGNQLLCAAPLELMLVDSEPKVIDLIAIEEPESSWAFLVSEERYIREGR